MRVRDPFAPAPLRLLSRGQGVVRDRGEWIAGQPRDRAARDRSREPILGHREVSGDPFSDVAAGPLMRSSIRANRSRTAPRPLSSPAATLTRCCTVSMSTVVVPSPASARPVTGSSGPTSRGTTSRSWARSPSSCRRRRSTGSWRRSGGRPRPARADVPERPPVRRRTASRCVPPCSSRSRPTRRCGGASPGGAHRTNVGESSDRPENRASSSRWAARCHGSSCGVPTRRRLPRVRPDLFNERAKSRLRSTQPVVASSSRSTCTLAASIGPSCPLPRQADRIDT